MKTSFITTTPTLDETLRATLSSVNLNLDFEHLVTYAFERDSDQEFITGWRHVRFVYDPGCGIARGFNTAIRKATGDCYIVLNSGDRLQNTEKAIRFLEEHPDIDAVYGAFKDDKGVHPPRTDGSLGSLLQHGMPACHTSFVIRRRFHEKHGLYPENFRASMDYALLLKAVSEGCKLASLEDCLSEIEPPGISASILPRVREYYRAASPYGGKFRQWIICCRWFINSFIMQWINR